ncbi:MAG: 1-deoxy-D-xylulose-5-phosphate reductoisomerase [Gemmataceae bacterium]|nr:1-deoxy-D-xylulose-5-phosphate reductoisomerase [Gemmataceae bacterium]
MASRKDVRFPGPLGDFVTTSASTAARPRRVVLLGSTGSIGTSCLDVVDHLGDRLQAVGLSAHGRWQSLMEQARRHRPRWVTLTDRNSEGAAQLKQLGGKTEVLFGEEGVVRMVSDPEVDVVVTAIVGAAGLTGTWAALEAGKTVAVANKETLVMAGPLVMDLARRRGVQVLPVDSEHSAIFQAMRAGKASEVERIVLTASGGPFRGKTRRDLANVTKEEALRHPTWQMGPKITIDSATLMNKALEVIEARWLFGIDPERIEVIIHPESMIHSFVEFKDGSVLAQLSPPDMRLPIQYALTYPERVAGPAKRLNWRELGAWHFEQPDLETFPALQLGYEVARQGGTCGSVLNATNEAAVQRFLGGELRFLDITHACRDVLANHHYSARPTLAELTAVDRWARQEVARWTPKNQPTVTIT